MEAARAGEAGLGFSVVADEVRMPAKRSADAARDTAAVIVAALEATTSGEFCFQQVGNSLGALATEAAKAQALAGLISAETLKHTQSIAEIAGVLQQLETTTEKVTSEAQSQTSVAGLLSQQVSEMHSVSADLAQMAGIDRS